MLKANFSAAIDIGTNSVKLTVMKISYKTIKSVYESTTVTRLGKSVILEHKLDQRSVAKTIKIIKSYIKICKFYRIANIRTVVTEVLRKANDRDFFINLLNDIGVTAEILTPKKEAFYSFTAAAESLKIGKLTAFDLGGGSLQIVHGIFKNKRSKIIYSESFQLGAVFLTERFIKNDPPTQREIDNTSEFVRHYTKKVPVEIGYNMHLVGIGGTVAVLKHSLSRNLNFSIEKYHGSNFSHRDLSILFDKIKNVKTIDRIKYFNFDKGRADIIIAGTIVILELMDHFQSKELTISAFGLRHGILMSGHFN